MRYPANPRIDLANKGWGQGMYGAHAAHSGSGLVHAVLASNLDDDPHLHVVAETLERPVRRKHDQIEVQGLR